MKIATCSVVTLLFACTVDAGTQPSRECGQLVLADVAPSPIRTVVPLRAAAAPASPGSACWIDDDAVASWSGGTPTWVDVRPPASARGTTLAGALRIALADLPRKSFLQAQPLVLVGTGFDDVALAQACEALRREGFARVRLLRGGVRAWRAAGRAMAGMPAEGGLDSISAAELHRSVPGAPWVVLGVGMTSAESLPPRLSPLRSIDGGSDAASAVAAVAQARRDIASRPPAERASLVVVVAADAQSARELRTAVRRAQLPDVLTLEGGLAGYRQFLAEQESIAASAGKPLVRPCGTG